MSRGNYTKQNERLHKEIGISFLYICVYSYMLFDLCNHWRYTSPLYLAYKIWGILSLVIENLRCLCLFAAFDACALIFKYLDIKFSNGEPSVLEKRFNLIKRISLCVCVISIFYCIFFNCYEC